MFLAVFSGPANSINYLINYDRINYIDGKNFVDNENALCYNARTVAATLCSICFLLDISDTYGKERNRYCQGAVQGLMTIKDIAEMAHVSKGTVSRVINGVTGVGEETRRRVSKLIE